MKSLASLVASLCIFGCITDYRESADSLQETDWIASNIAFVPTWESTDDTQNDPDIDLNNCLISLEESNSVFAPNIKPEKLSLNTKKLFILKCMADKSWYLVPNEVVITQ